MDDLNARAARNRKIKHAVFMVLLIVLFICFIFPFLLVLINVFKVKGDINSNPLALVGSHGFTLKNFPEAMQKMNFRELHAHYSILYHCDDPAGFHDRLCDRAQ